MSRGAVRRTPSDPIGYTSVRKKFDFLKKSPVPNKRSHEVARGINEFDDNASDFTDPGSEPGTVDSDVVDVVRSATPDPGRNREVLENLRHKIDRIKIEIQKEQQNKEEHVKDYLELSAKAGDDESALRTVKKVFEAKNLASTQAISKLQKKLDRYVNEKKKTEQYGASTHKPAKDVLKDVGQGIKDFGGSVVGNIKVATEAIVSKPKELAGLGAKSKGGSADNLNTLANTTSNLNGLRNITNGSPTSPSGSTTLPANFTPGDSFKLHVPNGSEPNDAGTDLQSASEASYPNHARDSPHNSSVSPELSHQVNHAAIDPLVQKLNMNADNMDRMARSLDMIRNQICEIQEDMIGLRTCVEEERYADRYDRLEEHLNDFVELTQHEVTNLKQEIANMEEKIDYQLEERTRDLQEALENVNTRMTKMELQNQHQQLINMEGVDNANAKVLLTKFINIFLAFLAVILVCVSTVSTIIGPFLNARWKVVAVGILVIAILITSSHWEIVAQLIEEHLQSMVQEKGGHT